jgi:putative DNA methylase
MAYRKKLIEVALPLDAINKASAREKSIRHGHPSTLHLWWARRPLAAARAVIFSQMVDDPSSHPELFPTKEAQDAERQRLFRLIEELVRWENTTNNELLEQARNEIRRSWRLTCAENQDHPDAKDLFNPDKLPAFHDPFAGGGALPLEAQRLGLKAYASDLNPVAVLINKATIEIPPKFAGRAPVNPEATKENRLIQKQWKGAQGLADDVRYYGKWMRDEAEKRIGHLYPKVVITAEMAEERPDLKPYLGRELTVIAWLWARTVQCPNPACKLEMPLLSSFILSSKKKKERYLHPIIDGTKLRFNVDVESSLATEDLRRGYKRGKSGIFECAFCGNTTTRNYVAHQGVENGLASIQTAVVLAGDRERLYVDAFASKYPVEFPQIDLSGLDIELAPQSKRCMV